MALTQTQIVIATEAERRSRGLRWIKDLGEGASGKVKLARYKNQKVAAKILELYSRSSKYTTKFFPREIQISKEIQHPNIVSFIDSFTINSTAFIIMEYCPRGDLYDYIKLHAALPEGSAQILMRQLLEAMKYLQEKKIIHRDLKCENILLDWNYNVKLTDFGFSRYLLPDETSNTYCGSPSYVAPEFLRGEEYSGMASDIWSIGVIMYIMLSGFFPFNGETKREMYDKMMAKQFIFPNKPIFSQRSQDLISKIFEPEPSNRPNIKGIITHPWLMDTPYNFYTSPPKGFRRKSMLKPDENKRPIMPLKNVYHRPDDFKTEKKSHKVKRRSTSKYRNETESANKYKNQKSKLNATTKTGDVEAKIPTVLVKPRVFQDDSRVGIGAAEQKAGEEDDHTVAKKLHHTKSAHTKLSRSRSSKKHKREVRRSNLICRKTAESSGEVSKAIQKKEKKHKHKH